MWGTPFCDRPRFLGMTALVGFACVAMLAQFRALLGWTDNPDKTMVWLERAYAEHSSSLSAIKVDPTCDPVCSDPLFQDLVRRFGLAQ